MGRAKEIEIKVIPSTIANPFVRKHHYSGKVVNNSCLHFGAFLDGNLHGVLSYGPSLDKSKMIGLVEGTGWNNFLELNRMAFDEYLPRNSESCCISRTLTMIKKNTEIFLLPNGEKIHVMTLHSNPTSPRPELGGKSFYDISGGKFSNAKYLEVTGAKPLVGYQLRYIYFIDKSWRKRLTVPEIPFSEIDKIGAGMYKGEKVTQAERHHD